MRFSILLLGAALSVVCAQAPTPAAIIFRQEASTSAITSATTKATGTPGVPGVPGTPGTVRILNSISLCATVDPEIHSPELLEPLDIMTLQPPPS
jgi:hypothetical protein